MKPLAELIGVSPGIAAVRETVGRLLSRQSDRGRLPSILIQGETGTGKGLLARALHRASARADGPFIDVNCAAIPETLIEAELFGFERGAFTDARQAKAGLFQAANRGTLFLDEVSLLPDGLQAKLLKAIEERVVRRLGSTRSEAVDVWILTASNENLAAAARARRFREDLYHRLTVVTIWLPPLRERSDDVLLLAEHFLARACADYDLRPKALSPDARTALVAYAWPGNVRELANVMERVALLSEASLVTTEMLALPTDSGPEPAEPRDAGTTRDSGATSLEGALDEVERAHLLDALRETRWNITHAAARLGISRDTLRYRIAKHDLRPEEARLPVRPRPIRPAPKAPPRGPAPPEAPPPAPAGTVRWERRRLAFLRTTLALQPGADPRLRSSRAVEVLLEKVRSFGGRVDELSPGGLVGVFGLEPVEDAPRRAAHAAMAIQRAAERAARIEREVPTARSAIHVGQYLIGQGSVGVQIDLEAKQEAWAALEGLIAETEPGRITVSAAAAPFLERHFDLLSVNPSAAAGERTYRLEEVEPQRLAVGPPAGPFVGRHHELELLRSRLALAMRGHGQAVGILGEVGIGKSRLIAEFRRSLQGERVTYREGHCQSYGNAIPYLPVLEILRQNFRIIEPDGPEAIADKVRLGLEHVGMDAAEWAPYFLHLFGVKEGTERLAALTPVALKTRVFEALRQLALAGSRRRPLVFVIEDLHWVDSMSEECLLSLMESTVGTPALLIFTYRPGYRPPWVDKSYATQVALQPLSHDDSLAVIRSVLQREEVPDPLAAVILEKTEGNPFFLEELSRAVGEAGELRPPVAVPDTIQEVLVARIARLSDPSKRLLQTAAVLGRTVPLPLLRAVWDGSDALEPCLNELTRLEFLYQQSGGLEPVYAFIHPLTQEVAHESLPTPRRQALHLAAGQALERIYADRLEEVYDRLSYHYARAEQAEKAVLYLRRLAEKAARGHAHTEAVRILDEALAHAERLPAEERERRRVELILQQADSLVPVGGFGQIVELLGREEGSLERLQDATLAGHFHFLMSRSALFLGDEARATRHAILGIAEATRSGDEATLGKIHYVLAQRGALAGRALEGIEHARRAVTLLERAGERWWVAPAHWTLGLNHALRGEFELALAAERQAGATAQEVGDPQLRSSAAWATGVVHAAMGEADAGVAACQEAVNCSPDPLDTAIAVGWLGYAAVEAGTPADAIPRLEQAIAELGRFRFAQLQGLFTVFLAEAHRLEGQLDRARELGQAGLALTTQARALYGRGWAERTLGRIAVARGDLDDAEARLGAALRTFTEIEAWHDAARTHLDLATAAAARLAPDASRRHLEAALALFRGLGVPRYVGRTLETARALGMSLAPDPVS